jgi:hypothetical protein
MVPSWFLDRHPSGTALLAYVALASFGTYNPGTGRYEECRPSIAVLAQRAGVSESHLRRGLAECIELGGVQAVQKRASSKGGSLPTLYRVVFGEVCAPPPVEGGGTAGGTPPGTAGDTPGVPPVAPNQEGSTQNPSPREDPFDAEASPNAGLIVKGFIDWLAGLDEPVKLTPSVIARYGREIKTLLGAGFSESLIKRALVVATERGQVSWPSRLQSFVVEVQNRPVSGPPAAPRAPQFKNSEEQAIERRRVRHARAKVLDELMAQGLTFDEAKERIEGATDEDYLKLVAPSTVAGYIDGDVIDSTQRPEVES